MEHKNFLQSPEFAEWRRLCGDEVVESANNYMVIKNAKRGRHAEIAGAVYSDITAFANEIRATAKAHNCAYVRIRPQLLTSPSHLASLHQAGFRPAPRHLYAENTVVIDLAKPQDDILADMRKQTRYEIRHLDRHPDLTVTAIQAYDSDSSQVWEDFADLQAETARRQDFVPPSKSELLHLRTAFGPKAILYQAKNRGQVLAYALIIASDGEADYFEAASHETARDLPVAYAIQWQIIRDMKDQGIKYYNLFGIAPEGAPNHRYAKLTTFKRGFGEVVNYVPAHDLPISPLKYQFLRLYALCEKKRLGW